MKAPHGLQAWVLPAHRETANTPVPPSVQQAGAYLASSSITHVTTFWTSLLGPPHDLLNTAWRDAPAHADFAAYSEQLLPSGALALHALQLRPTTLELVRSCIASRDLSPS